MIAAHGGKLVNKIVSNQQKADILEEKENMFHLKLDKSDLVETENIATGLYSPIEGFMNKDDYKSVRDTMRLSDGTIWTIPIVLGVDKKEAAKIKKGQRIALTDYSEKIYAVMDVEDIYTYEQEKEAEMIYKTQSEKHPGVKNVYKRGCYHLGGEIHLLRRIKHDKFNQYRMDPTEVRNYIKNKGWERVVGFQTRNPIHRAHEYLQKCSLEITDGLLLSPLVGETKSSDIPADYRIRSYEVVMDKIYPKGRVFLSVFPAAMRYAGPKEAVFHALCRKNYGCTHFIVGRDHAGVGDYYGTYEAQNMFDNFSQSEIGIIPLRFEYSFYCKKCKSMATTKTCPHSSKEHIGLSGTKVRKLIREGKRPPEEMTRPEVADILIKGMSNHK